MKEMNLHVMSGDEHLEVTLAIVKDIKNDAIELFLPDGEITIRATTSEIERIKHIVVENTIPFIPVHVQSKRIIFDAKVPELKLLTNELQELE